MTDIVVIKGDLLRKSKKSDNCYKLLEFRKEVILQSLA